jgi:hypothetical protein
MKIIACAYNARWHGMAWHGVALTLLCPASPSPLAISADQESMVASNLTVFIVEDAPAVRDALGLLLRIRG